MNLEILLKTNTHYNHLWPILNDTTHNFESIYICSNDFLDFNFNKNIKLIRYNQSDSYTKRLINILKNLESKYVLITHDVDIILNFNFNALNKYKQIIEENDVDRLSLGVYNGNDIIDLNGYKICKLYRHMSKNFFTPFDYTPSIYNREKLIDFYSNFENETYRGLELNENAQQYIVKNFKSYGIQKSDNIKLIYHRGFVYSEDFNFLHLTVQGKFLSRESYFDLIEDFEKIKFKYNLSNIESMDSKDLQKNEI